MLDIFLFLVNMEFNYSSYDVAVSLNSDDPEIAVPTKIILKGK